MQTVAVSIRGSSEGEREEDARGRFFSPSSSPSASPLILWIPVWIFDVSGVEIEVGADRWLPVVDGCRSCLCRRICETRERYRAEAQCLFSAAPILISIENSSHTD